MPSGPISTDLSGIRSDRWWSLDRHALLLYENYPETSFYLQWLAFKPAIDSSLVTVDWQLFSTELKQHSIQNEIQWWFSTVHWDISPYSLIPFMPFKSVEIWILQYCTWMCDVCVCLFIRVCVKRTALLSHSAILTFGFFFLHVQTGKDLGFVFHYLIYLNLVKSMASSTVINHRHKLLWLFSLTGKVILSQTEKAKTLLKGMVGDQKC